MQPILRIWRQCFPPAVGPWQGDLGLLLLRLWFGGAMLVLHGVGKLGRFLNDPNEFSDPIGLGAPTSLFLATFAELLCAALVVLGLGTRLAAVPLVITMLVAGLIAHQFNELALSYALAYVVLVILGPGRWSLDQILRRRFWP